MQKHALARLGLVVWSSLALSCASDSGSDGPYGMGGTTGAGGSDAAGSGGGNSDPSAGAGAAGTGGSGVAGASGGTAAGTGSAEAGSAGTGPAGSGSGGVGPGGNGGGETGGQSGGGNGSTGGGLKNPPVKSAGCGKAPTITAGKKTIMSGGRERAYIIDIPANYDPEKPYRLFYASHGLGGRAEDVAGWNYFGLKTQATAANDPAIFIAPQAIERWDESDHALFDDITGLAKNSLCIDTTRVFVTGMSFGGMITYSLSTNHQKQFRAGVALAPANFNIWLPAPKLKDPIPWMQTTGMSDTTCPWDGGNNRGAKYIALEKAADNGCAVPASLRTWKQGDPRRHICVDLEGCKAGYPVKVCTFDGGHWQFPYDDGNGENLSKTWVPVESWKFFTQF
ncbi:MAG: putative secreted protein [Polyangiaceae bacterium]|nr:putative secreted protein [Polyangiaceae bacterium]